MLWKKDANIITVGEQIIDKVRIKHTQCRTHAKQNTNTAGAPIINTLQCWCYAKIIAISAAGLNAKVDLLQIGAV